jgi:hypothetical protein
MAVSGLCMPICCFLAYLFECISTNSTDYDGWLVKTADGASVGHRMGRWGGAVAAVMQ